MFRQHKFAILSLSFLLLVGIIQCQAEAQQQQPPPRVPFFQPPPPRNPPPGQIQQQPFQQPQRPQQPGIRPEDILRIIPQFIPPDQFDEPYDDDNPGGEGYPSRSRPRSRTQVAPRHVILTADQFWMLSREEQQQELRRAVSSLTDALDKTNNAQGWKDYLGIEVLKQQLAADQTDGPDTNARKELAGLAGAYAKVNDSPEYRKIAAMPGFQTIRVALPEYSRPPLERSQRHVAASNSTLQRSLDRMSSRGAGWKEFLQLGELSRITRGDRGLDPQPEQPGIRLDPQPEQPGIRLDPQPEQPGRQLAVSTLTQTDIDQLKKIETRFQQVQGNPQYVAITQAPGFQQTLERLSTLVVVATGQGASENGSIANEQPEGKIVAVAGPPQVINLDLSGNWSSNLGKVSFRQAGDRVSGTLTFSNGVVATISGTLQGGTLAFDWQIPNSPVKGTGKLVASSNGNGLSGTYQDVSQGTDGPFNMTRDDVPSPLPAPPPIPKEAPDNPAAPSVTPKSLVPAVEQDAHSDGYPFAKAKARSPGQPVPSVKITRVEPAPEVP